MIIVWHRVWLMVACLGMLLMWFGDPIIVSFKPVVLILDFWNVLSLLLIYVGAKGWAKTPRPQPEEAHS